MKSNKIINQIQDLINTVNPLAQPESGSSPKSDKVNVVEQTHNDLIWIDIVDPTRKDLDLLLEKYKFHPFHLTACITKGQHDRLEVEEKYLFVLMHAPKFNKKENKITTARLCLFVGKKFLITIHKGPYQPLSTLFEKAQNDTKKSEDLFKKSGSYIMSQLLAAVTDDISSLHDQVLNEVDDIEDLVFDVTDSGVFEITQLRQKIVRLKRVVNPFSAILQGLITDQSDLTSSLNRYFRNILNDLHKLRELLDEAKEVVEIYKDADVTLSAERTNKILGILTIIFTLAIPAQILGAFYGMNVYIPGGSEVQPWLWFGPYTTFYTVVAAAAGSAFLMFLLFKKKRWF